MVVVAPIELWQVYQAHQWPVHQARLISSGIERSHFSRHNEYVYYRINDPITGRIVQTSDVRPGDFPFSIALGPWTVLNTQRDDLRQIKPQNTVTIYRAPDGHAFFFERGDYGLMSVIFILSIGWWLWVLTHLKSPNGPIKPPMTADEAKAFTKDLVAKIKLFHAAKTKRPTIEP